MTAPIYVVVTSDDLFGKWLELDLQKNPGRKPNPIVFETCVNSATLETAKARAAQLEKQYGACRVGRVVFEDEAGFEVQQ